MDIKDAIRHADSEHVVFFLLTSYIIEALQFCNRLPARLTSLPLTGIQDVGTRYRGLMIELDSAPRKLDDTTRVLVTEALLIFGTALRRLELLHPATDEATVRADGPAASPATARVDGGR
jgi:hypothetical protein